MIAKKANIKIPTQIAALFDKEIAQKTVIDKQDIEKEILSFLSA
jgi:threonine synthase